MNTNQKVIKVSGVMTCLNCQAEKGDIFIYRRDYRASSLSGRLISKNFNRLGYYLAKIFDGENWQKLAFNKLVGYENRSYFTEQECTNIECCIQENIIRWRGEFSQYDCDTNSFRIFSVEIS